MTTELNDMEKIFCRLKELENNENNLRQLLNDYNKRLTAIETKHSHVTKSKIDVISHLNKNVSRSSISIQDWINQITVTQEHFEYLFENTIIQTIIKIFEDNLNTRTKRDCIKCFNETPNVLYIYTQDWKKMECTEMEEPLKKIQNGLLTEFTKWGELNVKQINSNNKISERYNNLLKKIIDISFKDDTKMHRVISGIYNLLKEEL